MRGPLLGTKVRRNGIQVRRRGGSPLAGIGARGRREARGSGVLTERSEAERASTRRPEESLSARSPEPARTRGRPAPQRRSALTRTPQGRRLPGACDGPASNRGSKTRPRSGAKRNEGSGRNRQRVRTRNRQRSGPGHIYTYIPLPTQHERPSPDYVRGRTRVCVGARPRAGYQILGAHCKRKTVALFTE